MRQAIGCICINFSRFLLIAVGIVYAADPLPTPSPVSAQAIQPSVPTQVLSPTQQAGFEKSQACAACHNVDGNSTVPVWPNIAGQPVKYLIEQLREFRKGDKGTRFNPLMYGITQNLSDQDIADLAAYFSSQKLAEGSTQEKWVALGEKIYRGGNPKTGVPACSACHSPRAEGNIPAGFPPLSGQHPDYTLEQLKAFRNGTRSNDPNAIMRDITKAMTEEEMQAVSHYVSGLH